jgi:hypothetical protein
MPTLLTIGLVEDLLHFRLMLTTLLLLAEEAVEGEIPHQVAVVLVV